MNGSGGRGMSPVVGVVFMMALIVILSAFIVTMLMGFAGSIESDGSEPVADSAPEDVDAEPVESSGSDGGSGGPLLVIDGSAVLIAGVLIAAGLVVRSERAGRVADRVGSVAADRVAAWRASDGGEESDPVDEVQAAYVEGELGEVEFEREVEQALQERSGGDVGREGG